MSRTFLVALATVTLMSSAAVAAIDPVGPVQSVAMDPRATDAATVVDAFHAALKSGDTAAALAMLAEDVMIFEEGGAERSRDEYASHHLEADAAFASTSEATILRRAGWAEDDVAWVTSEGRTTGKSGNRDVNRLTVETMVLKRGPEGWRIHHIHWSSRAAAPA